MEDIVEKIDESEVEKSQNRAYLGASMIGNECEGYLQMGLRGYPKKPFPPNVLRIFQLGHIIEDLVVGHLKKAGYHVMEKDDFTGRQFEWKDIGGHIKAHADGMIDLGLGRLSLLEIKSMNDKKHKEFVKRGIKAANKTYYEQVQMMMGMSGTLKEALFIAYNKNNSTYHCEVVEFDDLDYAFIVDKANRVLAGSAVRLRRERGKFPCSWCDREALCWTDEADEEIPAICRTCDHARAHEDGGWKCTLHKKICDDPCDDWVRLKMEEAL
jgi:Zn finger protein HypA/HybF involved in hydrogenase expression